MNARPHLQCRQMMRDDNGTQNDEVAAASAVQESRLKWDANERITKAVGVVADLSHIFVCVISAPIQVLEFGNTAHSIGLLSWLRILLFIWKTTENRAICEFFGFVSFHSCRMH